MLNKLISLFRRGKPDLDSVAEPISATLISVPKASPKRSIDGAPNSPLLFHQPSAPPRLQGPAVSPPEAETDGPESDVEAMKLQLQPIVDKLPDAMKARVITALDPAQIITLPIAGVQEQLRRGVVKVTFGSLRKASPAGTFGPGDPQHDRLFVEVPLRLVVAKAQYSQRPNQRKICIPDDVLPAFDLQGHIGGQDGGQEKDERAPAASTPASTPAAPPSVAAVPAAASPDLRLVMPDTIPGPPIPPPAAEASRPSIVPPAPVLPAADAPAPAHTSKPPKKGTERVEEFAPLTLEIDLEDFSDDLPATEPVLSPPRVEAAYAPGADEEDATPASLLAKASELQGVAGVLLCSHDGLVIENRVPDFVDGKVLAAYLPEMWVRTRIYMTEMNFPEPESIAVNLGEEKLEIFPVGPLYFAALSESGKTLPSRQLRDVVGRLSVHALEL